MKPLTQTLTLLPLLAALTAWADDDDDDERKNRNRLTAAAVRTTPQWKAYEAECGSCHLAFPPGMLPAKSWGSLLGGLANHFGANAEVDTATVKTLEPWLKVNAGPDSRGVPLRITALTWWRREHDEVSPATYARKAIVSPANCGACHRRAEQGSFGEHEVTIPAEGASPRAP